LIYPKPLLISPFPQRIEIVMDILPKGLILDTCFASSTTIFDFMSLASLYIFFLAACRIYKTALVWEYVVLHMYLVLSKLTVQFEWQEEDSKGSTEEPSNSISRESSTEPKPNDVESLESKAGKTVESATEMQSPSSTSSSMAISQASLSPTNFDSGFWMEKGSLFSEFTSVNNKKITYCNSDEDEDGFHRSNYGSIFEYDCAFSKGAFSPVFEPMNNTLFEEDKRFQRIDGIWGEQERTTMDMAKFSHPKKVKHVPARKTKVLGEANKNLMDSAYESQFFQVPARKTKVLGEVNKNLMGSAYESQSRSRPGSPHSAVAENRAMQSISKDKRRFMPGMNIMVEGGDCHGAFGYVAVVHDRFCHVCLFILATYETTFKVIAKSRLQPLVPNANMELTVNFAVFHARLYFCPQRSSGVDAKGNHTWLGMKVWEVLNPALKQVIPENSKLLRVNDIDVSDLDFDRIQDIIESLEPPYALTLKFPSVVQEIKLEDLFDISKTAKALPKLNNQGNHKNGRRKCLSKKGKNTLKRKSRGNRGKKLSWTNKE